MKFFFLWLVILLAACSQSNTPAPTAPPPTPNTTASIDEDVLDAVLGQGFVRCGVQGALPGFGQRQADGGYAGLDIDLCRALAAAVFGNAEKVEFVELTTAERFPALQERRVDVLMRNTTWTLTRDSQLGLDFGPVTFYDGQGVMVRLGAGVFALIDLADRAVCIQPETTTKTNFDDTIKQLGVAYEFVAVADLDEGMAKLSAGACDALSSDRSALAARRATAPDPANFAILEVVLSQEPLAPVFLEGSPRWGNVIRWTLFGIIHAERLGINAQNIDSFRGSDVAEVQFLLGESGDLGTGLGLQNSFIAQAVRQVGNYGELYERNLGTSSGIGLARGQNALWLAGGLLYAPPFR